MPDKSAAFENVEPRESLKVAALDIGSNSFHLVVARIVAGSVQVLHKVKQKVRLANGLDSNNMLSDEAIQRGLDTLNIIAESLKGFEPDTVRIVATYTLRKAKNAKVFIKQAKKIIPYPIEVISGIEEARLIYSGVAHTNYDEGQRLVIDIGGGSTEFALGNGFDNKLLRSLKMGCVSYTNRFFADGLLTHKAFNQAITAAQQQLELIDEKFNKLGWKQCIGTSGTIKIVAILAQLKDSPEHNGHITLKDLTKLIDACCSAGHVDGLDFDGMTEDRRPVFAAGLAILTATFKSLQIDSLVYSPAALREGVIYEMEEQMASSDIRQRTADSLATRYDVDIEQAHRVLETTLSLHQQCAKKWQLNNKQCRDILSWAALLHEIGLHINSQGVQRHSGYILSNVDLPGFNDEQQQLLSVLARFHRKKIRPEEIPELNQYSQEKVYYLMILLRIAVLLNIKRQDNIVPSFSLQVQSSSIDIKFADQWLDNKPIFTADLIREKEQLKALNFDLNFS